MAFSGFAGSFPLIAALGPTNTGKTHRAVERMLEHGSGMIGLPLRLLAREVYDRITQRVGEARVALVTGEEKRIPARPQYWVCTVEAMPMDKTVDFLAVDEIQLSAHAQRGHVFTDRLLHARGLRETWFMGADTLEPLLRQLLPTAQIQRHPRFSKLTGLGSVSLGALPPRSAVVAFSTPQVYEIAERLRQRRGGTAVVLGALSPRTRNAQVAMYQSGEVQYMVATDAIGMGLNMDVDLVAFAALRKFDGRELRGLEPAELAQIAGRAGRHYNDGAFATLAPLGPIPEEVTFAIENHQFPAERRIYWRNSDLDLSSLDALIASLRKPPPLRCLRPIDQAEDYQALVQLAAMAPIRARARGPERVALLWDVCRIPDYRQLLIDVHVHLLAELYMQLSGDQQTLDPDWMNQRICRIDDTDGDIEALMSRIAFIRTWTYIANHTGWIRDPRHWQERTRAVEDRLSDALHQRLIQRFVSRTRDTKGQRARPRPNPPKALLHEVSPAQVSHNPFRALLGLKLAQAAAPAVQSSPQDDWVEELVQAPHEHFHVDPSGRIYHGAQLLGRLTQGADLLRPEVTLALEDEPLGPGARLRIARRLGAFARDLVEQVLAPLHQDPAQELSPAARGLVYLLEQRLGSVPTSQAQEQLAALTPQDRKRLRALDVHLGRRVIFVRQLLKPQMVDLRIALCSAYLGLRNALAAVPSGAVSFAVGKELEASTYTAIGYPVFASRAIRADFVEKIDEHLAALAKQGPFEPPALVARWLACKVEGLPSLLEAFGYRKNEAGQYQSSGKKRRRHRKAPNSSEPQEPLSAAAGQRR